MISRTHFYAITLGLIAFAILSAAMVTTEDEVLSNAAMRRVIGSNPQTQRYQLELSHSCTTFMGMYGSGSIVGFLPDELCGEGEADSPCYRCSVAYRMTHGLQQAMGNGGDEDVIQDCGIVELGTCQPDGSGGWTCLKENTGDDCIDLILVQSQ